MWGTRWGYVFPVAASTMATSGCRDGLPWYAFMFGRTIVSLMFAAVVIVASTFKLGFATAVRV
jgi:hypothetical protein